MKWLKKKKYLFKKIEIYINKLTELILYNYLLCSSNNNREEFKLK